MPTGVGIFTKVITGAFTITADMGFNYVTIKPQTGGACTVLGDRRAGSTSSDAVPLAENEPLNLAGKNAEPLDNIVITPTAGSVNIVAS